MSEFGGLQTHENTQHALILGSATRLLLSPAEGDPNFTNVTIYETKDQRTPPTIK